jgi:hypothetical protein
MFPKGGIWKSFGFLKGLESASRILMKSLEILRISERSGIRFADSDEESGNPSDF